MKQRQTTRVILCFILSIIIVIFTGCGEKADNVKENQLMIDADIIKIEGIQDFTQMKQDYVISVQPEAQSWTLEFTTEKNTANEIKKYSKKIQLKAGRNECTIILPLANSNGTGVKKIYTIVIHRPEYVSPYIGNMIPVPHGTFQRDAEKTNLSTVSEFSISQYEITRNQFWAIMGYDPSDTHRTKDINAPVQLINWYEAITFCNRLSILEGYTPCYTVNSTEFPPASFDTGIDFGKLSCDTGSLDDQDIWWNSVTIDHTATGYRLPSYMEWMWAAMGADTFSPGEINRTGYLKEFAGSNGANSLSDYAVYGENKTMKTDTFPVGTKLPNELGIFDMTGNVSEWLTDIAETKKGDGFVIYTDDKYSGLEGPVEDYTGMDSAPARLFHYSSYQSINSSSAICYFLNVIGLYKHPAVGFRVIRREGYSKQKTTGNNTIQEKVEITDTTPPDFTENEVPGSLFTGTSLLSKSNSNNVDVRIHPSLKSDILFQLRKNQVFTITGISEEPETINGSSNYWYRINLPYETTISAEGLWIYGEYSIHHIAQKSTITILKQLKKQHNMPECFIISINGKTDMIAAQKMQKNEYIFSWGVYSSSLFKYNQVPGIYTYNTKTKTLHHVSYITDSKQHSDLRYLDSTQRYYVSIINGGDLNYFTVYDTLTSKKIAFGKCPKDLRLRNFEIDLIIGYNCYPSDHIEPNPIEETKRHAIEFNRKKALSETSPVLVRYRYNLETKQLSFLKTSKLE